jgi:hypothetical protein
MSADCGSDVMRASLSASPYADRTAIATSFAYVSKGVRAILRHTYRERRSMRKNGAHGVFLPWGPRTSRTEFHRVLVDARDAKVHHHRAHARSVPAALFLPQGSSRSAQFITASDGASKSMSGALITIADRGSNHHATKNAPGVHALSRLNIPALPPPVSDSIQSSPIGLGRLGKRSQSAEAALGPPAKRAPCPRTLFAREDKSLSRY